jgi:hypothetical protein
LFLISFLFVFLSFCLGERKRSFEIAINRRMVTLNIPLHSTVAVAAVTFALNPVAACYSAVYMMFLVVATSIGLSLPPLLVGQPLQGGYRLVQMPYMTALLSTVACVVLISNVSDPATEPEHHMTLEGSWLCALAVRIVVTLWGMALTEYAKSWAFPETPQSPDEEIRREGRQRVLQVYGVMQLMRLLFFAALVMLTHVTFVFTLYTDVRVEEVESMVKEIVASSTAGGGSGDSLGAHAFLDKAVWTHRLLCNVLIIATLASLIRTVKPLLMFAVIAWNNGAAAAGGGGVWRIGAEFRAELWRSIADLVVCCCVITLQGWLDDEGRSALMLASGHSGGSGGTIPLLLQLMIVYRFYNVLVSWSANTAFTRILDLFELRPPTINPTATGTLDDQEAPPCIICLAPLGCRQTCVLPCRHEFHAQCVQSWLVFKRQCPVCRDDPWLRLFSNLRRQQEALDEAYGDHRAERSGDHRVHEPRQRTTTRLHQSRPLSSATFRAEQQVATATDENHGVVRGHATTSPVLRFGTDDSAAAHGAARRRARHQERTEQGDSSHGDAEVQPPRAKKHRHEGQELTKAARRSRNRR